MNTFCRVWINVQFKKNAILHFLKQVLRNCKGYFVTLTDTLGKDSNLKKVRKPNLQYFKYKFNPLIGSNQIYQRRGK
jgi:hypothetical protein